MLRLSKTCPAHLRLANQSVKSWFIHISGSWVVLKPCFRIGNNVRARGKMSVLETNVFNLRI